LRTTGPQFQREGMRTGGCPTKKLGAPSLAKSWIQAWVLLTEEDGTSINCVVCEDDEQVDKPQQLLPYLDRSVLLWQLQHCSPKCCAWTRCLPVCTSRHHR